MSTMLVTYDLKKPGQDYSDLLKEIKSFAWARLSESSYAVDADLSPKQLYDRLAPYLDTNDQLYVIGLHRPFWGYGPKAVNDWLERYLDYVQVPA